MNDLKIVILSILGLILGAVLGFIAPLLVCYSYDVITNPSPGSGLMTVGWIFCFFTIPIFAIIGCIWTNKVAKNKYRDH
jgi:hypothetical protein